MLAGGRNRRRGRTFVRASQPVRPEILTQADNSARWTDLSARPALCSSDGHTPNMVTLVRRAFATLVCLLFAFLWLWAGNPDPLGPWIALLAQEPACGPNPIVCENLKAGG